VVRARFGDEVMEARGTYRLDATADPMTIDLTVRPPGREGTFTVRGIYEVTGDKVRLAFTMPGAKGRPTGYDGKAGTVVITARRQKANGETGRGEGDGGEKASDGDRTERGEGLVEENRRLRQALQAKEDEVLRLRREVARLRGNGGGGPREEEETDGRLDRLLDRELKAGHSDGEVMDALYLATLSRRPTAEEKTFVRGVVRAFKDRRRAFGQLLWVLTNSKEFGEDLDARKRRDPRGGKE
jgi:hypothetical protein